MSRRPRSRGPAYGFRAVIITALTPRVATVKRDWVLARAWLNRELGQEA